MKRMKKLLAFFLVFAMLLGTIAGNTTASEVVTEVLPGEALQTDAVKLNEAPDDSGVSVSENVIQEETVLDVLPEISGETEFLPDGSSEVIPGDVTENETKTETEIEIEIEILPDETETGTEDLSEPVTEKVTEGATEIEAESETEAGTESETEAGAESPEESSEETESLTEEMTVLEVELLGEDLLAEEMTEYESEETVEMNISQEYDFLDTASGIALRILEEASGETAGTAAAVGLDESSGSAVYYGDVIIPEIVERDGVKYRVTALEDGLFSESYELYHIVIPDGVTQFGAELFSGKSGFTIYANPESSAAAYAAEKGYQTELDAVKFLLPEEEQFITGQLIEVTLEIPYWLETYIDNTVWHKNPDGIIKGSYIFETGGDKEITAVVAGLRGSCSVFIEEVEVAPFNLEDWEWSNQYHEGTWNAISLDEYIGSNPKVYVPAFFEGRRIYVTDFTFRENTTLISVTFEEGVLATDTNGMFHGCSNLVTVTGFPDGGTDLIITFSGCQSLVSLTKFPAGIKNMNGTFSECVNLKSIPDIPASVENMESTFFRCNSLKAVSDIPAGVESLYRTFEETALEEAPDIPANVKNLFQTFFHCEKLKKAPVIHAEIESMVHTFEECYSLEEAPVIPDSVTSMVSTFRYCRSLNKVPNLPRNLENMSETFEQCMSLKELPDIPESVTNMEAALAECISLEKFPEIPAGVTNVGEMFYGCTNLKEAPEIPSGVTNMAYTFSGCTNLKEAPEIPSGVTSMACTFSGCSSLRKAPEIPDGVTNMDGTFAVCESMITPPLAIPVSVNRMDGTFASCIKLNGSIDLYARPKSFDRVFSDTSSYSEFDPETGEYISPYKLTVNYTRDNVDIIDAMLSDYNSDRNVSAGCFIGTTISGTNPSIPSGGKVTENPSDAFLVNVTNTEGEAVPGAQVTFQTNDGLSYTAVSDELGAASVTEPEADACRMVIQVSAEGYQNKTVAHEMKKGTPYEVALIKDEGKPAISGVLLNNIMDIFNAKYLMTLESDPENAMQTITVLTENFEGTGRYQLLLGETVLAESDTPDIMVDFRGQFSSDEMKEKLQEAVFYVRVVGESVELKEQILLEVVPSDSDLIAEGNMPWGSELGVLVDESIPYFGGTKISLNTFSDWPVELSMKKDGRVCVSIGLEKDDGGKWESEQEFNDFIKKWGTMKASDIVKPKEMRAFGLSGSIQLAGYGEGFYDKKSNTVNIDVKVCIKLKAQGKIIWYFVTTPLYLKLEGTVEDQFSAYTTISFDMAEKKFEFHNPDADNELSVKLTVGPGIGIDDAVCAGVQGGAIGTWKHNVSKKKDVVTLQGTLGVSWIFGPFKYEREWTSQEWQIYPQVKYSQPKTVMKALYDESNYTLSDGEYQIDHEVQSKPLDQSEDRISVSGVYPNSAPQTVSFGGKQYLFYTNMVEGRTFANSMALVYRVLEGGVWSKETIVDDDGTADLSFSLQVTDEGILVTWQNASKIFDENMTYEELAENTVVSAALVGGNGQEPYGSLTQAGHLPNGAVMLEDGSGKVLCWYEKSENTMGPSGTSTLYCQRIGADSAEILAETDSYITSAAFGVLDNELCAAWSADQDNNLSTVDDREVWMACGGQVVRLTENSTLDSRPRFAKWQGKDVLLWYNEGNLQMLSSRNAAAEKLFPEDIPVFSDDYTVNYTGNKLAVSWHAPYTVGENAGQVIYVMEYDGTNWGAVEKAAESQESILSYGSGYDADGNRWLTYTNANFSEDNFSTKLNICRDGGLAELKLQEVTCDTYQFVPGQAFEITAGIANESKEAADGTLQIVSEGSVLWTTQISALSGKETRELTISDFVPDYPEGETVPRTYEMQLLSGGQVTDSYSFTLGYADFSVSAEKYSINYTDVVTITVKNHMKTAGDVFMEIVNPETEEIVYSQSFFNLGQQSNGVVTYNLSDLYRNVSEAKLLVRIQAEGREEEFLLDNTAYIYNERNFRAPIKVKLSSENVTISEGEIYELSYEILNGDTDNIRWESSDTSVVSVNMVYDSDSVEIYGEGSGEAVISIYVDDQKKASCTVTVESNSGETECEHPYIVRSEVQPGCTQPGSYQEICDTCGEILSSGTIPAIGHSGGAATCTEQAVCSTCGERYGELTAHIPGEWITESAASCAVPGMKAIKCTVCGQALQTEAIPANGIHTYGAYTVTKVPTVLEKGVETRTCTGCGQAETRELEKLPSSITLNAESIVLRTKQSTTKLKVSGLAEGDSIASWSSNNTKIVKVSSSGKITAGKKTGKAVLTVTLASGLTKDIPVTVQKKAVTTAKISGLDKKVTLERGKKLTLQPEIAPITTEDKVKYTTSNKKVATVNSKGMVTAKGIGKAKITVSSGKKKFTVTVTVPSTGVTAVKNVPKKKTLKKGSTWTIKPKLVPDGSKEKITFTSSDKKVVTVTSKGKVMAKKKGTAVITVKAGSSKTVCKITVK